MTEIRIIKEIIEKAPGPSKCVSQIQSYVGKGLKRETYTVMDDRDQKTESESLQLSNFGLLEDRETKIIEFYLTKLGANGEDRWRSDAYRHIIEVD